MAHSPAHTAESVRIVSISHLHKDAGAKNEQRWTSYPRNATPGACSEHDNHQSYGWFSDIEAEPEILYLEFKHDIESGVYKVRNMHVPVKRSTIEISLTGEILSGDAFTCEDESSPVNTRTTTRLLTSSLRGSCADNATIHYMLLSSHSVDSTNASTSSSLRCPYANHAGAPETYTDSFAHDDKSSPVNIHSPTHDDSSEVLAYAIPYDIWRIQPLRNDDDDECDIHETAILPMFYIYSSRPRRATSWFQCAQSCMRQYSTCIHFTLYAITACVWYVMLTA